MYFTFYVHDLFLAGCYVDGKHFNHNDVIERHDCFEKICKSGDVKSSFAHSYMDYCEFTSPNTTCEVSNMEILPILLHSLLRYSPYVTLYLLMYLP